MKSGTDQERKLWQSEKQINRQKDRQTEKKKACKSNTLLQKDDISAREQRRKKATD